MTDLGQSKAEFALITPHGVVLDAADDLEVYDVSNWPLIAAWRGAVLCSGCCARYAR